MTITVEFIRRRPGGRITVKPTSYDKKDLKLGRATDCDIHLPDLRVGLHHAVLTQLSADKVRIETDVDYRMRVDGALVRRREFSIGRNNNIRIGPYQLALNPADNHGDLLVSIELVEPTTAVGEAGDEDEIFSMKGYAPPRRTTAWLLGLIVAGLFFALPIGVYFSLKGSDPKPIEEEASEITTFANKNWLSGELDSAHANLVGDCTSCHEQAFTRVKDEICLSCHEDTRNHSDPHALLLAAPATTDQGKWLAELRATLKIPEGRCGSCHFEHNGPTGVIPTDSKMCVSCHAELDKRVTDTSLINVINFSKLHPEFKLNIMTDPEASDPVVHRVSLVDRPKENNNLKFPHDFHMTDPEVARKVQTLQGEAKARYGDELDCTDCHLPDAAREFFIPIEMERSCSDCHSLAFTSEEIAGTRNLPHGKPEEVRRMLEDYYLAKATELLLGDQPETVLERQLSAEARREREALRARAFANARQNTQAMIARIFSEEGICQKCHTVEAPRMAGAAPYVKPVKLTSRYMDMAEFSHAEHMTGNIECGECHRAETSSESSDVLMPGITTCRTCHNDLGGRSKVASDCLTCHIYHDGGEDAPLMTPARVRAVRTDWPTE